MSIGRREGGWSISATEPHMNWREYALWSHWYLQSLMKGVYEVEVHNS